MSFDAVTWAKAQRMPFQSAQIRARAKAVLQALAAYVDAEGVGWAAMSVLVIETDLGHERTVYRGLADLKACGLIEETGEKKIYRGKAYPIYRLRLEDGPQNTRERLRAERDACSPLTRVSGEDAAPEISPDMGVSPSPDTGDDLPLTPVSDKQEGITLTSFGKRTTTGAREVAARLSKLEGLAPKPILRFYDQQAALAALQILADEDYDLDLLPGAMERMKAHPDFRTRKHPPQLHDWLRKRAFIGWLEDDAPEAADVADRSDVPGVSPNAASVHDHAAGEADQTTFAEVRRQMEGALTENEFASYIRPAFLGAHGVSLYFVAATGIGRDWIAQRCWRRVCDAWAKADPGRRPLQLVSKLNFEALVQRQSQGAA